MIDANGVTIPSKQNQHEEDSFKSLCRHLVVLCISYQTFNTKGEVSKPSFFGCAGMILSVRGQWNYLTAGHILKNLDEAISNPRVNIISSVLADTLGLKTVSEHPIPFDFENAPKFFVDDEEEGLDFGLISLNNYYRRLLEKNGIVPISEENWVHQHRVDFDGYIMLGLPEELSTEEVIEIKDSNTIICKIVPTMFGIKRLEKPPKDVKLTKYPRFVGKLDSKLPLSNIEGMSGGPIFAFKENDQSRYWIVAIQSSWLPNSRITFGCPVPVLAGLIEKWTNAYTYEE